MKALRFSDPSVMADITVKLLPDGKVMAKVGKTSFHYMFHPGHFSGEVDLHKTNELLPKGNLLKHVRLGAVPRTSIIESLKAIGPRFMGEFARLWRPIRLESVIRQGLIVGARIPTDLELAGVKKISIRSGPAHCAEPVASLTKAPEFYEDVLQPPFAAYLLFRLERCSPSPFAVMLPYSGPRGKVKLRWAKIWDIQRWQTRWESVLWLNLRDQILPA